MNTDVRSITPIQLSAIEISGSHLGNIDACIDQRRTCIELVAIPNCSTTQNAIAVLLRSLSGIHHIGILSDFIVVGWFILGMDTTGFVETVMAECDRTEIPEIAFGIVPCCGGCGTFIIENIVVEISLRFERITVHECGSGTIIHDYVVYKVGRSCIGGKEILDDKVATVIADIVADYIIGIAPHVQHPATGIVVRVVELVDNIF